jgi:O-antigen/teichoic acid export membrane protein
MPPPTLQSLDSSGRLRRLFSDSVVYGSANAVSKLLALITFPLLARNLTVADYGTVDLFLVLGNWLALILILGVDSALARLIVDRADDDARAHLVSQALVWLAGLTAFAVPALWLASGTIARAFDQAEPAETIVRLIALQLPLTVIVSIAQALLRWTFQRRRFVILSLGTGGAGAFGLVIVFVAFEANPQHVFAVGLAAQSLAALVALVFIRRWLVWPRNFDAWRVLLPMALPLGVASCIVAAVPMLERSLVNAAGGALALGHYAAGAKIAALLSLPIVALQSGWTPLAVAIHREPDAARTYNQALLFFAWLICALVLVLAALGPWLLALLASDRYAQGAAVVLPLALALGVQGIGGMLEVGITVSKRMHLILVAYLVMLAAFAGAASALADALGPASVAWGLLVGQTAFALASTKLAQRAHAIPWRVHAVVMLFAATLAAGLALTWVRTTWGAWQGACFAAAAISALLAWGLRHTGIRETFAALARRRSSTASS